MSASLAADESTVRFETGTTLSWYWHYLVAGGGALAWAAYCAGEGALAGVALEQALETDPQHSLARLLLTGLYGGIRPEQMRQVSSAAAAPRSADAY